MLQVPFSMIALIDHIRQKDLPAELKCRQVRYLYREMTVVPDYNTIAVVQPVSTRASCKCTTQHCWQVFPTSGGRNSSLWDVASISLLLEWLDEHMDESTTNEVFEVGALQTLATFINPIVSCAPLIHFA